MDLLRVVNVTDFYSIIPAGQPIPHALKILTELSLCRPYLFDAVSSLFVGIVYSSPVFGE